MSKLKRLTPDADSGLAPEVGTPQDYSPVRRPSTGAFLDSIIASKVQPSPVRAQTLARDRLLGWLSDHSLDRLKLITAEAGYGKTTLVADFSRRGLVRCLWYKLDTSDREWVTFVNYLIAAGRQVVPGFAPETAEMLRRGAEYGMSREVIVRSLIAEFAVLGTEPTLLILDDFHLVDDSDEVKEIVARLLAQAPPALTLLLASRRQPALHLGRLRAQGAVSQLFTDDLRFLPHETKALFAETFGLPLDTELLQEIDAKTEGWGASLQLLYSSIRTRRPADVHNFVMSLTGAEGSLHDFLAEEVMDHLSPDLQRFVTEASILTQIVPPFALAILSRHDSRVQIERVTEWINGAEEIGLLSRSSVMSVSRRFHPLLRDFLLRRLEGLTSIKERREMHLRVAAAAEPIDSLAACHHFIEAEEHVEAMRILNDSAADALSTGCFGMATELLLRIQGVQTPPAVLAIQARALAVTDPSRSLQMLASIDLQTVSSAVRALLRQIRTYALFRNGDSDEVLQVLEDLVQDETTPSATHAIGVAHLTMLRASLGRVPIRLAAEALASLARDQVASGQHYFAAVSFHNALICALAQGDFGHAVECGRSALGEFRATDGYRFEAQSTRAGLYVALMERGDIVGANEQMEAVLLPEGDADADAFADIASVRAIVGDTDGAMRLLVSARRRLADGWTDLAATASVVWAEALVLIVSGQPEAATVVLATLPESLAYDPGHASVQALRTAAAAVLSNDPASHLKVTRAVEVARVQGAWAYEARANILLAAVEERRADFKAAVCEASSLGCLALLEMADVLGRSLYLLDPVPSEIIASIQAWPARWMPVLRRALEGPHLANAMVSARLLAQYGSLSDTPMLAAFDKMHKKHLKGTRHAKLLTERVSDHLYLRDLGRLEYMIGNRVIPLADTRRKAASLSAYLVTRPGFTATREQVLDDMWPESDPQAASNSLHQTLYFLRRDIDPWYDDHSSAGYISYEGEMLWFNSALVSPESAAFDIAASSTMSPASSVNDQLRALALYRGRFAPDFEYEEWSLAWRNRLHASYLSLTKVVFRRLVGDFRFEDSIRVCQLALAIDSSALDIELALVWVYASMGSASAAAGQYGHFAAAHQSELGLDAPSLTDLCALNVSEL